MKKKILYLITLLTIISFNQKLLSQNKNIEIKYERNPDKSVDISYTKELPGSYYLKLEFTTLTNCSESRSVEQVIKNSSGTIIKLRPINSDQHITFSYKYSSLVGNPNPKIDSLFNYTMPLKKGKKVKFVEAFYLSERLFGSEKPSDWKSYFIYRKKPDTICSMRKGIVVQIVNEFETDTLIKKSYSNQSNSIRVEHSDGTYAFYGGFKKNSIFVKLGQAVYPQTKLGILDTWNTDKYRLSFSMSYLNDTKSKNKTKNKTKQNLKNQKSSYTYLTPYFMTENGSQKLKPKTKYIVTSNEKTLFEEFTKREKKKYKKNPELFE